jgi:hypothetical protein
VNANNETWEKVRSFKTTKIEQKQGIDSKIDMIRFHLNKITDKNYIDIRNKIVNLVEELVQQNINNEEVISNPFKKDDKIIGIHSMW